jgi:hypothetical protein
MVRRRSIGANAVRNGAKASVQSAADIRPEQNRVRTARIKTSLSGVSVTPSSFVIQDITTSGSGEGSDIMIECAYQCQYFNVQSVFSHTILHKEASTGYAVLNGYSDLSSLWLSIFVKLFSKCALIRLRYEPRRALDTFVTVSSIRHCLSKRIHGLIF